MRGEAGSRSVSRATVEEKPAETGRDCGETKRKEGEPEGEEGVEKQDKSWKYRRRKEKIRGNSGRNIKTGRRI